MQASRRAQTAHHRLQGDLTVAEIAGKYQFHPNLVQQWKKKLLESASDVFMTNAERKSEEKPYTEDDLMKKIGQLEVENDFLRSVSFFSRVNLKYFSVFGGVFIAVQLRFLILRH